MLLKVPPQGSEFLEGGIAMYMEHMEIRALLDDFRAEFLKRPDYKPENQREEKPLTIVGEE